MASCAACKNLDWPDGIDDIEIPFQNLELSAQAQKCSTCKMLYDGIILFRLNPGETVRSCNVRAPHNDDLRITLWLSNSERHVVNLVYFNVKDQSPPWAKIVPKPSISGDTGSDTAHSWVLQKALNCITNHQICLQHVGAPLPTRVIDVGVPDNQHHNYLEQAVTLYETRVERAPYVCLSHCWGKFQPCKTTMSNLASHKTGIPFHALPRTFQDAVTFVRKLPRIRYLWIDSLCIIQDSPTDWRKESANMWAIYQGSFLSLAASRAHDATEGCFSVSSRDAQGYSIPGDWNSSKPWEVHVRQSISHGDFRGPTLLDSPTDCPPLLQRAWVFQERLLAPRVLYFAAEELVWECSEETVCECSDAESIKSLPPKPAYSKSILDGSPHVLMSLWEHLVSSFTKLRMTKSSDCFPAISGLAKQINSAGKLGQYYGGLWQGFFIRGMLWRREVQTFSGLGLLDDEEVGKVLRPDKWRAPSWSWASVNAPVEYPWAASELRAECQLTEIKAQGLDDEAFGELQSGWITLLGDVVPVSYYQAKPDWAKYPLDGTDLGLYGVVINPARYYVSTDCFDVIKVSPDYEWERGPTPIPETEPLYCLKVASSSDVKTEFTDLLEVGIVGCRVDKVYFLVLRRIEEAEVYERVGIICVAPSVSKKLNKGSRKLIKLL